jgi:hypothetical protein
MTSVSFLATALGGPGEAAQASRFDAATIKAGLRTETPEEGGFVQHVLDLTKQGVLPPDLVDSTFQWARKKPRHRFQFFKRGLTVRAAALGITL